MVDTYTRKPLIGISCETRDDGNQDVHGSVGDRWVTAIRDRVDGDGVIIPNDILDDAQADEMVKRLDGLLLIGGNSMVQSKLYGEETKGAGIYNDPARDQTTMALSRAAIRNGVPLFCVCLGQQELNVSLGGSLAQDLHDTPGLADHRFKGASLYKGLLPSQQVEIMPGGLFARILGGEKTTRVNTAHDQAIAKVAPGLKVEARAPDGTVEGVSMPGAKALVMATQFHPEAFLDVDYDYFRIFQHFAHAAWNKANGLDPNPEVSNTYNFGTNRDVPLPRELAAFDGKKPATPAPADFPAVPLRVDPAQAQDLQDLRALYADVKGRPTFFDNGPPNGGPPNGAPPNGSRPKPAAVDIMPSDSPAMQKLRDDRQQLMASPEERAAIRARQTAEKMGTKLPVFAEARRQKA